MHSIIAEFLDSSILAHAAVGQDHCVSPIAHGCIRAGFALHHHKQRPNRYLAIVANDEAVLGQHGTVGHVARCLPFAVIDTGSFIGVVIHEAGAVRRGRIGNAAETVPLTK